MSNFFEILTKTKNYFDDSIKSIVPYAVFKISFLKDDASIDHNNNDVDDEK